MWCGGCGLLCEGEDRGGGRGVSRFLVSWLYSNSPKTTRIHFSRTAFLHTFPHLCRPIPLSVLCLSPPAAWLTLPMLPVSTVKYTELLVTFRGSLHLASSHLYGTYSKKNLPELLNKWFNIGIEAAYVSATADFGHVGNKSCPDLSTLHLHIHL